MAMSQKQAQRALEALSAKMQPAFRSAFDKVIRDILSEISLSELTKAIESGDFDALVRVLHIDAAAFAPLTEQVRTAFIGGGSIGAASFPPPPRGFSANRIVFRFDVRDIRSEQWLRAHSSNMVTQITQGQLNAARASLSENLARGVNPKTAALDIVGRINRKTKRREGGVLGLSGPQQRALSNADLQLRTGTKTALNDYLKRERRDKRFDSVVSRAIKDGKPIPSSTISRMTTSYSNNLLKLRGDVIARTETLETLRAGKHQATLQGLDAAGLPLDALERIWSNSADGKVRDDHNEMEGQVAEGGKAFVAPDGSLLMYPGDTTLGASAEQTIQCRCSETIDIDYSVGVT